MRKRCCFQKKSHRQKYPTVLKTWFTFNNYFTTQVLFIAHQNNLNFYLQSTVLSHKKVERYHFFNFYFSFPAIYLLLYSRNH